MLTETQSKDSAVQRVQSDHSAVEQGALNSVISRVWLVHFCPTTNMCIGLFSGWGTSQGPGSNPKAVFFYKVLYNY